MSPQHRLLPFALFLSAAALTGCGSLDNTVDELPAAASTTSTDHPASWLPEPTGPNPIGSSTRWIDAANRSVPVQLWFPSDDVTGEPVPYLSTAVAEAVAAQFGVEPSLLVEPTHALQDARPATVSGGWPTVVLSPGLGLPRSFLTGLAEDLASHGYVVAALDHPGDALAVETPTGELIPGGAEPGDELLATRVGDVNAAITYLTDGGDDVLDSLDPERVAVLGHSYGGATAAQAAATNPSIDAVGVLDGSIFGDVAEDGLDIPVLLLATGDLDPTQTGFWGHLDGPRDGWQIDRAGHYTFTDLVALAPALGSPDSLSSFDIGTDLINPGDGIARLVRSFLDEHLEQRLKPEVDLPDWARPIS